MKKVIFNAILIAAVTVLLNSDFIHVAAFNNNLPDLILILTVYTGFFISPYGAMFFGFAAGLSMDVYNLNIALGFNAFIYTFIGYLTFIPLKFFQVENGLLASLALLIFYLIKSALYLLLMVFIGQEIYTNFLIELVYTVIIAVPIFYVYLNLSKFFVSMKRHV